MKSKLIVGLGLLATLSAVTFAVVDGFTIKPVVKEGEVRKYKIVANMEIMGQAATFTATSVDKVLKVSPDGTYESQSEQIDGKVKFGENEMDAPGNAAIIYVYKADNLISEIKGESADSNAYRMATLRAMPLPGKEVNVGDTWTYDFKADAKTGAVAAKATFKVLGTEKVDKWDTLKIQATVKELDADGASAESTMWLSTADWDAVKMESKWTNVPVSGAPAPVNAKVTINRVE